MKHKLPFLTATAVLTIVVAVELYFVLAMNAGMFVYALDDAYIHLSLAQNIARGEYGINAGEFSSPSSSILWPFLLAPFASLSGFYLVPFIVNVLFSVGTLYIAWRILDAVYGEEKHAPMIIALFLILLIPAAGMTGLIFSGMEHSLQIFSIIAILYAIVQEVRGSYNAAVTIGTLIIASLVRYENLAIVLFAVAFFASRGKFRAAAAAGGSVIVLHLLFSFFLYHHGSTLLPLSVLLKTNITGAGFSPIAKFFRTISAAFGALYFVIGFLLVMYYIAAGRKNPFSPLCLGAFFAVVLHLSFGYTQTLGDFSTELVYFFRYEMYLWTFLLMTMMIVWSRGIQQLTGRFPLIVVFFAVAAELFFCSRSNSVLFTLPTASNNIYEQQYQNHRFVTAVYKKPVAANDIGYLSFNNEHVVLDVWGLASQSAARLRIANPMNPEWMDSLLRSRSIDLAIIYDVWFPVVPQSWIKLATLSITKRPVTVSESEVSYYSTNDESAKEIVRALSVFQTMLPEKSMLSLSQEGRDILNSQTRDLIREHTLSE